MELFGLYLFFKKNKILHAMCEFSVRFLLHFCVCVSLNHSGGFSSGIFTFARMVRFIFTLVFGPLVLGHGRKRIKEIATKV